MFSHGLAFALERGCGHATFGVLIARPLLFEKTLWVATFWAGDVQHHSDAAKHCVEITCTGVSVGGEKRAPFTAGSAISLWIAQISSTFAR